MSNLSNQQIKQSFQGLLQVPGGVTTELQPVQDGNGNPTGLHISSTGASVTTSSTFVPSVSGTQITGAVARLISDGFGDYVSVKDFGAVGNGVADDTTAIQTAINSGVKTIFFPPGSYLVSSTITLSNTGARLVGAGPNATSIVRSSGTTDVLSWSGSAYDGGVKSIKFSCNGMTGGNIISAVQQQRFTVSDCVFGQGYNGIYIEDQNVVTLENLQFQSQTGSYSIKNKGTAFGNADVLDIKNVTIGYSTNTSTSPTGIIIDGGVATVDMRHVAVVKGYRGLSIENSANLTGVVVSFVTVLDFQSDFPYDSGIYIDGGTGVSRGHQFTDCYIHHSESSYNVFIDDSVSYVTFKSGICTGAYKNGFYIAGDYVHITDYQISANGQAASNTYSGVEIAGTATGAHVSISHVGNWSGYATETQSYGVTLLAGATNYTIVGNNLRGNVTGDYSDLATDITATIFANTGVSTSVAKMNQSIQYTGSTTFAANGSVATTLTSVGPTGASTTVRKWLTVYDAAGNPFYLPCF